ncbi:UNVERIFIED_ORG: phosphodiesterase [Bacillus sp. AZ43]
MDSRRWWLLAAAVPVALGCALAALQPGLRVVGEVAVSTAGILASAVLWSVAARTPRPVAWRLLAVAPLFTVAGPLVAAVVRPVDPVQLAVVRWVPTVPGYLLAIAGILALVHRRRIRGGARLAVEVALFLVACLIVVSLLVVGSADRWAELALDERLVLGAAVVATSATMAAALTLLVVIEDRRRPMALVLLAGSVLLTAGRGISTSGVLSGAGTPVGAARILVAAGLLLLALAGLLDSQRAGAGGARRGIRCPELCHMLPYVALLVAVGTVGTAALAGARPTGGMISGLTFCVALTAVHRWLTAREERRLATALRRSEAYFRSVVNSAGDAVVVLDDALRVRWASPALDRSLGEGAGALLGAPLLDSVHPDDAAALTVALGTPAQPGGLLTLRLPDATGEWRYLEAGVSDLRDEPDVGAVVLHCRDMTERRAREQALQAVAYTDPLSGLPNRAGLLQTLQAATEPGAAPASLLMIELTGLTVTRANAGRETVTQAVAEVGRRLRATVRAEDTVARMGGGAFAVVAHGDAADIDRLTYRCLAVVEQPVVTPAGVVDLSAAVGVVGIAPGVGVETLLQHADLAVCAAHEAGPGASRRYDDALGEGAARSARLRHDLQGACDRGELFLLFQPIVSLEQRRITGVEAELRWRHGELGEIPPSEFVPVAERAGLIGDLVRWALTEAAAAAAGMPADGEPVRIGVKVPSRYLAGGTVVGDVEAALRSSGLAPQRLVLQIGAPALDSSDDRLDLDVASLRLMGVHVALHGFGSGSSALAHLTRLPIDIVHLDRSLITRIDRDAQSLALCRSVIGIGRALGLDVVAEGVETPAQLAALAGSGCDFAQGFVIARPVRLSRFVQLLRDGAGVLLPGMVGTR